MDFMNRDGRPSPQNNSSEGQPSTSSVAPSAPHRKASSKKLNLMHYATSTWLLSVALLIVGVILSIVLLNPGLHNESRLIERGKYQAVFLDGGQVYFGQIGYMGKRVVTLYDIYYLKVNQQIQPGQANATQGEITLEKLGCELHGPQDQMVISREKITFWENLKEDGQVANAVKDFKAKFPNGRECPKPAASSATPAASTPASTTPAASTPAH